MHAAGLRAFERAVTLPDLAVAFEGAQRDLRAFPPAVAVEAISPMLESLVAAKDARKAQLQQPADMAGDLIPY